MGHHASSQRLAVIGGSAGSLSKLQVVFESLQGDEPFTCFVVEHLSADHPSNLDTLVAKWSGLPVVWTRDGAPFEPGIVHLCAPGALVSWHDGILRHGRAKGRAAHNTIDHLAISLAPVFRADLALVILSGTGSDGTEGARAVKSAGGVVIVQAPESAEFRDMPLNVIDADLADSILPPTDIGITLRSWCNTGALADPSPGPGELPSDDALINAIVELVGAATHEDIASYKRSTVRRRIERRMGLRRTSGFAAYLAFLRGNPEEVELLAKDLHIGVTAFFRDPEAFRIIQETVVPALCGAKGPSESVRVWIAGCSTGEEAYSIAILLAEWFEAQNEPPRVQIFATDVDTRSLAVARAGLYRKEALAAVPAQRMERYFVQERNGYRIAKSVRENVVFASHDLISDPPFSKLDLVVCRNVLIYLNPTTQKKLLSLFHFVLNSGGYLFLGSSESVGSVARHFHAVSKQWRVFRHLDTGGRRTPLMPLTRGMEPARSTSDLVPDSSPAVDAGSERVYRELLRSYGPTLVLVNTRLEVLYLSGNVGSYLEVPVGEPTHDLLKMVKPGLAVGLRSAIVEAQKTRVKAAVETAINDGGQYLEVRVDVTPISTPDRQELLLVCFSIEAENRMELPAAESDGDDWVLRQLMQELNATREDLYRTIEQSRVASEEMKAANEEVMAMNEELQSANEELESSKEELQSLNEELTSSNSLLDEKVIEVEALNADLNNLLNSTNTATLLMDVDLNIRRFTPACSRLMRLIPSDIGRSVEDVVRIVDYPGLGTDCQQVIRGQPVEDIELSDPEGHCYLRRILPFLGQGEQVDGAVITFTDITALKRADRLLHDRAEKLSWQSNLLSRAAPVLGRDMQDRIVFWNKGAEALYGWSESEALGKLSHELLKTRFPLPLDEIVQQLLADSVWRGQLVHVGRDGSEIIVQSQWTIYRNAAAEPEAIVEVNNDVTKQKKAQQALRESEEMFHTMVDWTYNWEYWTDPEDKFVYMTPSVEELTGYKREEFDNNPELIDTIVHADDRIAWRQHRHAVKHGDGKKSVDLMMRIVRKNGETRWVSHQCRPVFGQQGQDLGRRVTVRDISAQKLAEDQVHALAYYDPLTHLPNRRLLMDRLHQAIESGKREACHGAVMMLDLDQFKTLNDSKGHDMGDALLIEVAKRVLGTVRAHDTVSRIGGDEFVVVLEDLNENASTAAVQVEYVADKIVSELRKPFLIGDQAFEYFVTSSVGVAMFDGGQNTPELLLKQADVALYQAKAAGRDTIRYFNPGMQAEINARSALESELRRALQNGDLRLYYQPQLDQHGSVVGAEALLRWQSLDRGLVFPDQFIPLAEESGLVVQIGNWVLVEACEQLSRWQADQRTAQLHLSINVSARQAQQADFVPGVMQALRSSGINPKNLMLELTESAVMRDIEAVAVRMQGLIELGVRFSLDDFGTGYSSLSHLKTLPFSQVKIDRSFVRDLADDPNDAAIVSAILAMSASLGLPVIAEGVETEEQHAFLQNLGCSGYQGYLFGRPVPIAEFEDLLTGGGAVGN